MKLLAIIRQRLRSLWQRQAVKREIDEELRFHLEQRTAENLAAGMSPEDAAREARRRFGNVQNVREECRNTRGANVGETVWQDIRFGARMLVKHPGFTAIAILTLALGIGANTTMFSVVNLILFRPLPFPDSNRLARIYRVSSRSPRDGHSIGVFMDIRDQNTVFDRVAAYYPEWPCNLATPGEPAELLSAMLVTADFFPALGMQPELGRAFTPEEDEPGHDAVAVLSHRLWQRRFNSDTNIVGRTVRMDGQNVTIVGVMPERLANPILWGKLDLLRPFAFGLDQREKRGDNWRFAFGRLKPGISMAQANAELTTLAGRFAKEFPKTESGYGLRVLPLRDSMSEEDTPLMWFSLGLACFVLLIACANLANLLLARLAGRSRELAIRLALGAGRGRLVRQLLTESLLVSLAGGAVGVLIAIVSKDCIGSHLVVAGDSGLPIPLDGRVLGFAFLSCVMAAMLFGTAPAWFASRKNVNQQLKEGARGNVVSRNRHRWRQALISCEMALALVLLAGAGLFIRGLQQIVHRDPGWRVDGLMTAQLDLTSSKYKSPDQRRAFFEKLQEQLAVIPGVRRAGISSRPPVQGSRMYRAVAVEGQPPAQSGQRLFAGYEPVSASYFDTVGIQLKAGRLFTAEDNATHPDVVIINETLARRFWPRENPIGKRIADADSATPAWLEIVGVVADLRFPAEWYKNGTDPQMYRPIAQDPPEFAHAELRFEGRTDLITATVRRTVADIDPDQSVYKIITAREFVRREMSGISVLGTLLAAFAGLGLTLAAIGIYGVVSYTVAQRSGEMGLRMALGARRLDVLYLVLRQGLTQSLIGVVLGLAGAIAVAGILGAILPFPLPNSSVTLVGLALVLIVIAVIACLIPARRATRIDPMEALRCE